MGDSSKIKLKCATCGKVASKACGNCRVEKYCSKECQVKAWKNHKHLCNGMKQKNERKSAFVSRATLPLRDLPKSRDFQIDKDQKAILKLLGYAEEDEVVIWCALHSCSIGLENGRPTKLLKLKILVQNLFKGKVKLFAKSVLLTMKGTLTRTKAFYTASPSSENPAFVELNGNPMDACEQVTLERDHFAVMNIAFPLEDKKETVSKTGLEDGDFSDEAFIKHLTSKCQCLEVPVKIEGKGVVKIKVELVHSQQQPVVKESNTMKINDHIGNKDASIEQLAGID